MNWTEDIKLPEADSEIEQWVSFYHTVLERANRLFEDGILGAVTNLRNAFGSLIDNLTDGILVHDLHRRIILFNHAAIQITGYSLEEVIGQDCHEVFPGRFCGGNCAYCLSEEGLHTKYRYPGKFIRKNGEVRDLELSVMTFNNHEKKSIGAMVLFRDITELNLLHRKLREGDRFYGIVGKHPSMHRIFKSIEDLAQVDVPILIQGESGTGKELAAEALHQLSKRTDHPFVPINCGALPEGTLESELFGHVRGAFTGAIRDKKGRFELADGGTLFLDEIGEISQALQVKLLRVIQDSSFYPVGGEKQVNVNVRIICATNRDLKKMVSLGTFREDLYYRLAVVPIFMPPLRERRSDIPLLVQYFIERHAEIMGRPYVQVSNEAFESLMKYDFPGNVRELSNAVQYAMIKCHGDTVQTNHLPQEIRDTAKADQPATHTSTDSQQLSAEAIHTALEQAEGNRTKAAEILGISRMTLYRHLKKM
ncbi:sigma 54-interacting transcriptional regulator [bacterium]|nr:sigma 54-interacting transcriptional regulator [bacterium]